MKIQKTGKKGTPYVVESEPYKVGNHWFINIRTLDGFRTQILTEEPTNDK